MPKICLITTVHQATDIRIFEKEANTLLNAGYQVVLMGPYPEKSLVKDGIIIKGIPKPASRAVRWLHGWKVMAAAWAEKADIYHFHDPELIIPGLLLQKLSRKPVIYDVHEYYSRALLGKPWIPGCLRRILSRLVEKVEKGAARSFAGIITVNDHMKDLFLPHNPRTVAVYNYPFIRDFASCLSQPVPVPRNGGKEETAGILYLGGLSRDRGLATVLEALTLLQGREGKAQLWVAGAVNFSCLDPECERRWQEGVAAGLIRYLGQIPYREIPELLQECRVTWLPWLRTPNNVLGIPTKLLEYMAAGKPVVASDFGFIAEIVRQAGCGLLVPAEDPQAHARAIEHLLSNPEEARDMGLRGQKAFLREYNWESQEVRLLTFYQEILASGEAGER